MGKRGPAPTPTAILKARGSWRANRNKKEPRPDLGAPVCPKWIPKEAKECWKQIVPILENMRVLTKADRNALTRYCMIWMRWREIQESDAPYCDMAIKLGDQLLKLEKEFGLTPSARSRIVINEPNEKEDTEKIRFLRVGS